MWSYSNQRRLDRPLRRTALPSVAVAVLLFEFDELDFLFNVPYKDCRGQVGIGSLSGTPVLGVGCKC